MGEQMGPERAILAPKQRFQIGDPVQVSEDFRYGEWLRVPLFVVAISYCYRTKEANYSVSDRWPPEDNGDYTDGFSETDLQPRPVLDENMPSPDDAGLRTALIALLREYDRNICTHEETHRAGFIWTICDGCGRKWADDQGGFKCYVDPPAVERARALVSSHPMPSLIDECWQDLIEKDDRTSPEEYPDMALITRDELAGYLARVPSQTMPVPSNGEDA